MEASSSARGAADVCELLSVRNVCPPQKKSLPWDDSEVLILSPQTNRMGAYIWHGIHVLVAIDCSSSYHTRRLFLSDFRLVFGRVRRDLLIVLCNPLDFFLCRVAFL